ncbi:SubName: Full=Uncharacterized protein {ECO:0000313/EMBL:CCA75608.1} [Serendipita indica DSM 11827]|nr:SubName: Full=Uncharacterized protein {ECO:0000313/EMBL:CCA75608.1} [Serendipita indica DSM 11827]
MQAKLWWCPALINLRRALQRAPRKLHRARNQEEELAAAEEMRTDKCTNPAAARVPTLQLGSTSASTNSQKSLLFQQVLFPPPPVAHLDDINNTAYDEPLEDFVIREKEVLNTIFQFPAYKAPDRPESSTLPSKRSAINSPLSSPTVSTQAFGWATTRKPDYTVPKAYRPIALEEALSSVCEAVLSRKLSQLAETANLLPQMQFGARSGRTTTDAILSLTKW